MSTFRAIILPLLCLAVLSGHAQNRRLVNIDTPEGRMVVALFEETPDHRDAFLERVVSGAYDSTLIHRAVPGLMLEGGAPESRWADDRDTPLAMAPESAGPPTAATSGHVHLKGALGAARRNTTDSLDRHDSPDRFYLVIGRPWSAPALERLHERRSGRGETTLPQLTPQQVKAYGEDGGLPHLDGAYTVFGEVVEGLDVLDRIAAHPCDILDRPLTDIRIRMTIRQ